MITEGVEREMISRVVSPCRATRFPGCLGHAEERFLGVPARPDAGARSALSPPLVVDVGVPGRVLVALRAMRLGKILSCKSSFATEHVLSLSCRSRVTRIDALKSIAGEVVQRVRGACLWVGRDRALDALVHGAMRADRAHLSLAATKGEDTVTIVSDSARPDPARAKLRMLVRQRSVFVDLGPQSFVLSRPPLLASGVEISQVVLVATASRSRRIRAVNLYTLSHGAHRIMSGFVGFALESSVS